MTQQRLRFPLGISDFRTLRQEGYHYVDKTLFIEDVLDADPQVLLVPRPRRFGKTVNLSTFRYFVEKSPEDRTGLFAGLAVASSEIARPHFQRYPVIFMSFKDVKPLSWESARGLIEAAISDLYREHMYLLTEGSLAPHDAALFSSVLERRATEAAYLMALPHLSRLLVRHHGQRVVILIDEYDTPIHAGYANGYYDQVVAFFRDFLSGGLKDNADLFKGVLTGILRVARESMFSGLNNIIVYSILRPTLATYFGFTELEVRGLVEAVGSPDLLDGVRAYYNGYVFGGHAIYNPWSVLSFLASDDKALLPYWIHTSSNDLVRELLVTGPQGVRADLETLLSGGTIDRRIDENVVLRDLSPRSGAVWSFLLFSGYLKAVEASWVEGELWGKLAVPNTEVAVALRKMVRSWLETQVGGPSELEAMLEALLRGDAPVVEQYLARMVSASTSYFDTAAPEPERFYHGLVVGLLTSLSPRFEVRSNRESGYGRCDVMVLPKSEGRPGVVLELKRVDVEAGETKEKAIKAALTQIRKRDYAAELRARGAAPIHEMAAVFDGKRVYVRAAGEPRKKTPAKARKKAKTQRAPRR
jgi:Predicted AAA-ATPase/PD-(D/E)XK nuclease superfamily